MFAGKVIGGTLYDLLDDDELLAAPRDEFETRTEDFEYESPLLPDTTPDNLTR